MVPRRAAWVVKRRAGAKLLGEDIQKNVGEIELKYHKSKHGIFVFSCSCWNSEVVGGFNSMGASVNKLDALVNCFMEGIQTWLMRISGTRDDWILSTRSLNIKALKFS